MVLSYMRFSKEFKLEFIRKYKTGEHINDPGGCKHKTFACTVMCLTGIYDALGEAEMCPDHAYMIMEIPQKYLFLVLWDISLYQHFVTRASQFIFLSYISFRFHNVYYY